MLKLAVTALRPHVAPPILFNEPNDVADFHVPMSSPALPNGEAERPRTGASSETSAHTFFRALGELAYEFSRPAPAIVRRR